MLCSLVTFPCSAVLCLQIDSMTPFPAILYTVKAKIGNDVLTVAHYTHLQGMVHVAVGSRV